MSLNDFDIIELNEAFASQAIGCIKAMDSQDFFNKNLSGNQKLGEIDINKLNLNGGAIALGHPVGATGTRIILHTLKELKRRNLQNGLATLCIGGGQGGTFLLESK
jgi:acetyl-CoA acetyltransferase